MIIASDTIVSDRSKDASGDTLSKTAIRYLRTAKRGQLSRTSGNGRSTHRQDVLSKLIRDGLIIKLDATSERVTETRYRRVTVYTTVTYGITTDGAAALSAVARSLAADDLRASLAAALRDARERAGAPSLRALATPLGLSHVTLGGAFSGDSQLRPHHFVAVCEALGTSWRAVWTAAAQVDPG